jgi:hypothetical protein
MVATGTFGIQEALDLSLDVASPVEDPEGKKTLRASGLTKSDIQESYVDYKETQMRWDHMGLSRLSGVKARTRLKGNQSKTFGVYFLPIFYISKETFLLITFAKFRSFFRVESHENFTLRRQSCTVSTLSPRKERFGEECH